jgi:hypothetical protein
MASKMASKMASAMDIAKAFLRVDEKEALRGASLEFGDPRSLQVRLLAMTRRANSEQDRRHYLELRIEDDYWRGFYEENR